MPPVIYTWEEWRQRQPLVVDFLETFMRGESDWARLRSDAGLVWFADKGFWWFDPVFGELVAKELLDLPSDVMDRVGLEFYAGFWVIHLLLFRQIQEPSREGFIPPIYMAPYSPSSDLIALTNRALGLLDGCDCLCELHPRVAWELDCLDPDHPESRTCDHYRPWDIERLVEEYPTFHSIWERAQLRWESWSMWDLWVPDRRVM